MTASPSPIPHIIPASPQPDPNPELLDDAVSAIPSSTTSPEPLQHDYDDSTARPSRSSNSINLPSSSSSSSRREPSPASIGPDRTPRVGSVASSFFRPTPSLQAKEGGAEGRSVNGSVRLDTKGKGRRKELDLKPLPLEKFTLYETRTRYYITATNQGDNRYRVLKVDRTSRELSVVPDPTIYSQQQMQDLLGMIAEGNAGGLQKVMDYYGIAGFVKFTQGWYMISITKRSSVALIGGHYVYHCDDVDMRPIERGGYENTTEEYTAETTFRQVDLKRNFYFSYTYDLTSTLQQNLTGVRTKAPVEEPLSSTETFPQASSFHAINHRYMWNFHLLREAFGLDEQQGNSWKAPLGGHGEGAWILPMIFGFIDQSRLSIVGRTIYVTLIGRRSRFMAGARYLKRGADENGHVANEVETEQIVNEPLTTSFHYPHPGRDPSATPSPLDSLKEASPYFTSFVQYRGSIPLLWGQPEAILAGRPMIEISVADPFFGSAARHFDSLFEKYGGPIISFNLIKAKESIPRESKLLPEYTQCIDYLNQFLPPDKRLVYIAWDMKGALKRGVDVVGTIEDIAEESMTRTGFFHSGKTRTNNGSTPFRETMQLQNGLIRTNCVDCLDRTNSAQFMIGKVAFAHQLYALGVISSPQLQYDCTAVEMLNLMHHKLGDTIAIQYSGGALVNRFDTYRRRKHWQSDAQNKAEAGKRVLANKFTDASKQVAIDLFLGIPTTRSLDSSKLLKRGYRQWFDPSNTEPVISVEEGERRMRITISQACDWYSLYYRPTKTTHFENLHAWKIKGTDEMSTKNPTSDAYESPFHPRPTQLAPDDDYLPRDPSHRWLPPLTQEANPPLADLRAAAAALDFKMKTKVEPVRLDPSSLEWKLYKSLAPEVQQEEVDEYIRWSASHEDELFSSHTLGRPIDLALYESTVLLNSTSLGTYASAAALIDSQVDLKTYQTYAAEMDIEKLSGGGIVAAAKERDVGFGGKEGWAFPKQLQQQGSGGTTSLIGSGVGAGGGAGTVLDGSSGQTKKRSHDQAA